MNVLLCLLVLSVSTPSILLAQSLPETNRFEELTHSDTYTMTAFMPSHKRIVIGQPSERVWVDTTKLSREYCDAQRAYIRENETESIKATVHDRARRNAGLANLERVLNAIYEYCLTEVAAGKTIPQYCEANDYPCPPASFHKK
ncbi:hypothetical protein [Spirosoma gilvum]